MMTLITGLPGNGKTLYALQYVESLAKKEGRAVYHYGIKNLAPELGWFELTEKDEYINGEKNPPIQVPQWWQVPAKSIVLIDEAQMCGFGVRPRGQVPEWGQKFETHRHLGIDVVLITQDPALIDSHDRKLCELHFHVMRTFGMQRAVIHEFRPVRPNVLTTRKGSIEHHWKFPTAVFAWYTSAEAHTHKRRLPARVVLLFALPFLIAALSWWAYAKYLSPNRQSLKELQAVHAAPGTVAPPSGLGGKLDSVAYVKQFAPRVPGLDYTAPVYDDVTKPTQAPYPAACVSTAVICRCYTQQGTRLQTPEQLCKGIVAGGFFVAWDKPLANAQPIMQAREERRDEARQAAPAFLGGKRKFLDEVGSGAVSANEAAQARQKTRAGSQPVPQG